MIPSAMAGAFGVGGIDALVKELAPDGWLDAAVLERLATRLDLDLVEVGISARAILRWHGHEVTPFEIRTNTWRIDLPAAGLRSVLGGIAAAAILEAAGGAALPTALLAAVAPLLFAIERVEIEPGDVTVHAQLRAAVGKQARSMDALYRELPAATCAELPYEDFIAVVDRLLAARLAAVGPEGVRVCTAGRRGFRLALSSPSLVPALLRVDTVPGRATSEVAPRQGELAEGYPRVFISYAHESADHKRAVLAFAEYLHTCGVGVVIDQDHPPYRDDWQAWATRAILGCDYVLVIASPMCRRVGDGDIEPSLHKGLQAEMRTLRNLYNDDYPTWLRRVLPVILPGQSVDGIPLFLQPRDADHYHVRSLDPDGAGGLLRTLFAS